VLLVPRPATAMLVDFGFWGSRLAWGRSVLGSSVDFRGVFFKDPAPARKRSISAKSSRMIAADSGGWWGSSSSVTSSDMPLSSPKTAFLTRSFQGHQYVGS
jgi:hypothetical protein